MKAREVKRAKLPLRIPPKLMRQLASCRLSPRTQTPSVCTTAARSRVVRRDTSASSAFRVFSSVRWPLQVSSPV